VRFYATPAAAGPTPTNVAVENITIDELRCLNGTGPWFCEELIMAKRLGGLLLPWIILAVLVFVVVLQLKKARSKKRITSLP